MPEIKELKLKDIPLGKFAEIHVRIPIKDNVNNIVIVRKDNVYAVGRNETIPIYGGIVIEEEGEKKIVNFKYQVVYMGNELKVSYFQKSNRRKKKKPD